MLTGLWLAQPQGWHQEEGCVCACYDLETRSQVRRGDSGMAHSVFLLTLGYGFGSGTIAVDTTPTTEIKEVEKLTFGQAELFSRYWCALESSGHLYENIY